MSLEEIVDRVLARYQELAGLMASEDQPSADEIARHGKEYSDLTPMVAAITELREAKAEIGDLAGLIANDETETDMKELAEEELAE